MGQSEPTVVVPVARGTQILPGQETAEAVVVETHPAQVVLVVQAALLVAVVAVAEAELA